MYEPRWAAAWHALDLEPPAGLLDTLVTGYRESHRVYHTLQHLDECLAGLDATVTDATRHARIELALWFHDAIYDTHRSDNETRCATWAGDALRGAGGAADVAGGVETMILATQHDAAPTGADDALMVDIDLAILGAGRARFDEYEAQIRREYDWVPSFLYRRKRRHVLQGFLDRPTVYSTSSFAERLEGRARDNLRRAIDQLT